jgi:hypothetical protein
MSRRGEGEGVVQWEVIGNAFPAIVHTRPAQQLTHLFKCTVLYTEMQFPAKRIQVDKLTRWILVPLLFGVCAAYIHIGRLSL